MAREPAVREACEFCSPSSTSMRLSLLGSAGLTGSSPSAGAFAVSDAGVEGADVDSFSGSIISCSSSCSGCVFSAGEDSVTALSIGEGELRAFGELALDDGAALEVVCRCACCKRCNRFSITGSRRMFCSRKLTAISCSSMAAPSRPVA
uniref:Uncharacterized protein n=1 Tax=Anopheles christyi TaxID=43041 RepID=A0A182KIG2_9DIPT